MTPPIFWVCWDYGQGGLWARVRAASAERVKARFPQLEVFETPPKFLTEETKAAISRSSVQDLDAAPSGWLADFVPPATQSISSAAEFERLLELVQGQLRNGTLKQRMAGTAEVPPVDVLRLPLRGPWPDVIEADFIDTRGQPYRLFVDGYHGRGVWQDLTSSGERDELPDWEFEIREVSAGVYRATGTDRVGHRVVTEGVEPDACLDECRSAARTMLYGG